MAGLDLKASVYIATSLDGFIAREDGGLDWLPGAQEGDGAAGDGGDEDHGFREFMDSVDVLVMGRNTYETVLGFGEWPYGSKRVVVLSSGPVEIPPDRVRNVEWRSSPPAELFNELSESGVDHIYVDGGKTIQGFLEAGLIEELIITTIPVLIGSGIPLFGPLTKDKHLAHIETQSFDNGMVQSKYRVIG